jgi:hypothetical protein
MDSEVAQQLFYLVFPLLPGLALLRLLGISLHSDRLAYWGWSWALGSLVTGLVIAAWMAFSPIWAPPNYVAILLSGGSALVLMRGRRLRALTIEPLPEARLLKGPKWERVLFRLALGFALLVACNHMIEGAVRFSGADQPFDPDPGRARILFQAGGFNAAYAAAEQVPTAPPLLHALLQTWHCLATGRDATQQAPLFLQAGLLALLLLLAGGLRCWVRPGIAALVLVLCSALMPFRGAAMFGHRELLVSLGGLIIMDSAWRWSRDGERAWLWLASLGLALALAASSSGVLLSMALAGALLLSIRHAQRRGKMQWKPGQWLPLLLPALAIVLLGALHHQLVQVENPLANPPALAAAIPSQTLISILTNRLQSAYLPAAFLLLALVFLPRKMSAQLSFGAHLVMFLLLALTLSPVYHPEQLIILMPLAALWVAACCGAHLGLNPSTHDPRAAAGELGALRPLRSIVLGYLLLTASIAVLVSTLHLITTIRLNLPQFFENNPWR